MGSLSSVWYRSSKDTWYTKQDGRNVSLGVRGRSNRREAEAAFVRFLATGERAVRPRGDTSAPRTAAPSLAQLVAEFLTAAEKRLKPNTVRMYRYDLDRLVGAMGEKRADKLTADELTGWAASLPVNDTTRAITLSSVSALYGWAVRAKRVSANPLYRVARPRRRSRGASAVISEADHARLLATASPWFADVLTVLHGTGCRPGEACQFTVENFDPANAVVRLTEHKTDRTGIDRLIFLPADVVALLVKLAARVKSGPLLRTKHGNQWSGRAITYMMGKTRKRAGVRAIAYGYRHAFATDALVNGVPDAQVSALLGHSSPAVLHKNYSHIGQRSRALKEALGRVRGSAS